MKITATSFKRSRAGTATFRASDLVAGHHRPTPPLETHGHSQASLGQPLVGSLLPSPEFWSAQGSVCALPRVLFPQSCVSSGSSMVGLMATSSKRAYTIPGLLHPEPLPLQQATADLYRHRRHSNTALAQSLWGLWVLLRRFV